MQLIVFMSFCLAMVLSSHYLCSYISSVLFKCDQICSLSHKHTSQFVWPFVSIYYKTSYRNFNVNKYDVIRCINCVLTGRGWVMRVLCHGLCSELFPWLFYGDDIQSWVELCRVNIGRQGFENAMFFSPVFFLQPATASSLVFYIWYFVSPNW